VQEVVRADGDGEKLPPSYRIESYKWRSDADIPFERYTSPEFFQREIDRMWSRTWQWACREEHIPETGDYYVYDIGPYSWLIVRTASGDIRAYQNACLHRRHQVETILH
jgi:phenylpropionate dioxygenase-like ring-hydroxylating dioxygenase large terminal subunit